jgi:hypothetical protein
MGDVLSGIGNAIGSAVDGLESVGGDALQVGGKLLSNPAIDTALGSMVGCPELGMIAPIIGGLTNSGGSSSPSSLGQMPGMFGGGGDPFGGLLNQGLGNIFGGGGLAGLGGGFPGLGGGFPGLGGGLPNNTLQPGSLGTAPGAGSGAGSSTGIPGAGGFDPNGGLASMLQQMQNSVALQTQMSAIQTAFQVVTKEISMAEDAAKTAMSNVH